MITKLILIFSLLMTSFSFANQSKYHYFSHENNATASFSKDNIEYETLEIISGFVFNSVMPSDMKLQFDYQDRKEKNDFFKEDYFFIQFTKKI